MSLRDLRRAGHWPSLLAGLLHFEVSFAVWVLLGVLGPAVARDFGLSPAMRGIVVATPLLSAAVFRVLVGWLADRFGPRRIGTMSMFAVLAPLAWGALGARGVPEVLGVGALLGIAGASFAVALPLASSHYPPSHQGLALGIAGAGNSGTIVSALLAPRLAEHIGWHATLGVAAVPVALAALGFRLLAREAPGPRVPRRLRDALAPLRERDCWRLCGLYAVTFGGYVGLASYLPLLLVDRFSISPVHASSIAAAAAGLGSLLRPVGGLVADRIGGTRTLAGVLALALVPTFALAAGPGLGASAALFVALLGALGAGNGAVFQLVPIRFPGRVGLATGVIGAAGGLGGFLLPTALGAVRQATGTYRLGLTLFAGAALLAAISTVTIRVSIARRVGEAAVGEATV